MATKSVKETTVHKKAFALAMEIFTLSKCFPPEERYSLTDQIRRRRGVYVFAYWKLIERKDM